MFGATFGTGSMVYFDRTTTVWCTFWMRGHLKCHVLCICYVPCYWQLPVLVFSSLPNIFRESLIRYLMPFLAFIGRTFAVWLRRLIVTQLPFHRSCWRTSSPHVRSTVLLLFGPGSSSIYPQVICYSSVSVRPSGVRQTSQISILHFSLTNWIFTSSFSMKYTPFYW